MKKLLSLALVMAMFLGLGVTAFAEDMPPAYPDPDVVYPGSVVCFYEQSAAAVVLLPFVAVMRPAVTGIDITLIAVLGVFCTAFAHSLFVSSLRRVKVQTAGIIAGMESVYGIILAALVLKMPPTARELIGGAIVLGVSLYTTISENREA